MIHDKRQMQRDHVHKAPTVSITEIQKTAQRVCYALAEKEPWSIHADSMAMERFKRLADDYRKLMDPNEEARVNTQVISSFCQSFLPDDLIQSHDHSDHVSGINSETLYLLNEVIGVKPVTKLQDIYGISLDEEVKFRNILVVGPPGVGKSTMVSKLRGWPEESSVDISQNNWWKSERLTYRPRELHLLLPFFGYVRGMAVFDSEITGKEELFPEMDLTCLCIPPIKRNWFFSDWRHRYVLEFILPTSEIIYQWRMERAKHGTHHHDQNIHPALVQQQRSLFERVARYLHLKGLRIYLRERWNTPPYRFACLSDEDNPSE